MYCSGINAHIDLVATWKTWFRFIPPTYFRDITVLVRSSYFDTSEMKFAKLPSINFFDYSFLDLYTVVLLNYYIAGRSYYEVLTDSFRDCDKSRDDKLDAMELMDCVEREDTTRHEEDDGDDDEHEMNEGHVLR